MDAIILYLIIYSPIKKCSLNQEDSTYSARILFKMCYRISEKHFWTGTMSIHFKNNFIRIIILVFFFIALSLWGFYWAIRPLKIVSSLTPRSLGLPFEKVAIRTADNILIRGWFIPNKNVKDKAIILLHGYPADKGDILPSRYFLHKKFNLLLIDFRYLGESEGLYSTVGKNEILDVRAAIDYLHKRGIHQIGIWGFSLGGAVALMTAQNTPAIKAVVAESSYSSLDKMAYDYFRIPLLQYPLGVLLRLWGKIFLGYDIKEVSPLKSAATLNIPLLIIHSRNDEVVSFSHAELFRETLKDHVNIEFLFYDDLSHGQASKNYQKIIEDFFTKNL